VVEGGRKRREELDSSRSEKKLDCSWVERGNNEETDAEAVDDDVDWDKEEEVKEDEEEEEEEEEKEELVETELEEESGLVRAKSGSPRTISQRE
jgi:hypothetical protein